MGFRMLKVDKGVRGHEFAALLYRVTGTASPHITPQATARWPALYGDDRDRWKLPDELRPGNGPEIAGKKQGR